MKFQHPSSSIYRLVLGAAIVVLLTECNIREPRENLQKCEFEFRGLEVAEVGLTKLDLRVFVGIMNPNASAVILDRLDFKLYTGGSDRQIAEGEHKENVRIPAGEERTVTLDVRTSPSQVGGGLLSALIRGGNVDYKLDGTVYLDTFLGEIAYPITLEGNTREGVKDPNKKPVDDDDDESDVDEKPTGED